MGQPTPKQLRTITRALAEFFTDKALRPLSSKDINGADFLSRVLRFGDNRTLLMTEHALSRLDIIIATLHDINLLDGATCYTDVQSVCLKVFQKFLAQQERPDHGGEFVAVMRDELAQLVDQHTFVVPIRGVKLIDIDVFHIGSFKIVPASVNVLNKAEIKSIEKFDHTLKQTKTNYWLIGSAYGTPAVAEDKFRAQAELLVGILAVCAGAMHQLGANHFHIGTVMLPEETYGASAWLSWAEKDRTLETHYKFLDKQDYELSQELTKQLDSEGILKAACRFFQADTRTSLEEAIAKAVYWYADAHREPIPVMRLVKYLSAVESFFSSKQTEITRSVSAGIATVLVFGGFNFIPASDYKKTKRRITVLYSQRSKALHRASHNHISGLDTAELSKWIAWMLINIISFQVRGFKTVEQIQEQADKLDAKMV